MLDSDVVKSNMKDAIKKLVSDTGRDDVSVITYSGHGTWVPDDDGDEVDGRDEALCPHDTNQGNILTDDELYDILGDRKRGARIIVISDSCHSGTVARACTMMPGVESDPWHFPHIRYLAPEIYIGDDQVRLRRAQRAENIRVTGKSAVLLSGCKDEEYSYDAWFNGRANGAFTYVALQTLKDLPEAATYRDWHREIRKLLPHVSWPQTPQLSGSWRQREKWSVFEE